MMKSRQEIKSLAKGGFSAQYGTGVLLSFLVMLFSVGVPAVLFASSMSGLVSGMMTTNSVDVSVALGGLGLITYFISTVVTLVTLVVAVNMAGAYVKLYVKEQASAGEPFSQLPVNFGRKLGGSLWMALFVWLWSLLFIIPGIVKVYAYRMTPYILARHPEVSATEALNLSKRMTKGNKGKLFVMDLSFIGWFLLTGLTFGILGIFYVDPYYYTTSAGFFVEIRDTSLANGVVSYEELGMQDPRHAHVQPQFDPTMPPPPPMN